MEPTKQQPHIVLVHGAGHGAWCWYKLKPLLEAAGHRVSALDLAASGIDTRSLHQVQTMAVYSQPLMEFMAAIPAEEKVVLVAHSLGGFSIALAMDTFPDKIRAAVFVTAMIPDTTNNPSHVVEQLLQRIPEGHWLDTEFFSIDAGEKPLNAIKFGHNFIVSKLYSRCPPQDVALAMALLRPASLFIEDQSKKSAFSKERYGSVKRTYIVCLEDLTISVEFQRWLAETSGVDKVKELEADHMPMMSAPEQLSQALIEIVNDFA